MGEGKDNIASLMGTRRLADAVRQAKIAAAQRSDAVVDIREADRARLEILLEEMQSLVDELPENDDTFDFTLSGGVHPRLWIDGTGNVIMARDRRTYRFVRETRLGRVTLAETADTKVMADHVTDYVAERIVERERAYALTDGINEKVGDRKGAQPVGIVTTPAEEPRGEAPAPRRPSRSAAVAGAILWLLLGIVAGAGLLLAVSWYRGIVVF